MRMAGVFMGALAMASLLGTAGEAQAALVLDTGIPTGSTEFVLSTAESFAAEFKLNAGERVTNLAAYVTPGTGNGGSFEFEIFSNNPAFINGRSLTPLYTVSANVNTTSPTTWSSVAATWTPTTTGSYWLAILEPNTGTTLDVKSEASTQTGTAPALEFASTNTPGSRYAAFGSGIGLEVTAVPIPAALWLMLSGLGGLGAFARRRKAV